MGLLRPRGPAGIGQGGAGTAQAPVQDPRIVPGKDFRNKSRFKVQKAGEVRDVNEAY